MCQSRAHERTSCMWRACRSPNMCRWPLHLVFEYARVYGWEEHKLTHTSMTDIYVLEAVQQRVRLVWHAWMCISFWSIWAKLARFWPILPNWPPNFEFGIQNYLVYFGKSMRRSLVFCTRYSVLISWNDHTLWVNFLEIYESAKICDRSGKFREKLEFRNFQKMWNFYDIDGYFATMKGSQTSFFHVSWGTWKSSFLAIFGPNLGFTPLRGPKCPIEMWKFWRLGAYIVTTPKKQI